jgi:hypothetical protein
MNENSGAFGVLVPIVTIIVVFSFTAAMAWLAARRKEREAFYRSETLKKIAETQGGGAGSALEFLREQEKITARHRRGGQTLGGLITAAVGIGMMIFLRSMHDPDAQQAYLVGLIPLLIGIVLLTYSAFLAPKE